MKTILTVILLSLSLQLFAAPVNGKIIRFKQPDGTTVDVKLYGDEYYIRAEGLDNYTLIRDKTTRWICYATLSDDGSELVSSGIVYNGRTDDISTLKSNLNIPLHIDISEMSRVEKISGKKGLLNRNLPSETKSKTTPLPVPGSIKGLCIVIDFSDEPATVPISEFTDFCNKLDYTNYGNNGSLRKYYSDVSGGALDYQNVVYGYLRAPDTFEYYNGLPDSQGAPQLLGWALNKLKSEGLDFSTLSINPDGSIVAINLMYTGVPQVWSEGLWWHQGYYPDFSANGVHSGHYNCSPANGPLILSTVAHENGHMIAHWPDTYKYTATNGVDGIGTFDLMCNYGDEYNPVPPNPLFRSDAGWGNVVDVTNYNGSITDVANSLTCYKYQINNSDEFFLIESRRKTGRSTFIADEGLTIWHIDRTGDNQSTHHEVYLEHANNNNNIHAQACFHAGFNSEFGLSTTPASGFYNGDPSGLRVRNISAVSNTMT
jgi:M6 family metalloprotease-like protein